MGWKRALNPGPAAHISEHASRLLTTQPTESNEIHSHMHGTVCHLTLNRPMQCRCSNDNLKRICLLNATDSHKLLTFFCQIALVTVFCLRRSISRLFCIVLYIRWSTAKHVLTVAGTFVVNIRSNLMWNLGHVQWINLA